MARASGFSGTLGVPRRRTLDRHAHERPDADHRQKHDRGGDEPDRRLPVRLVHQELDQADAGDEDDDEHESAGERDSPVRLMR
ncbi:MAG: hypothetical protein DMD99_03625 [Candidatus Rokuibacteriota bacterium]|nr:MAG: hypothetical protein DMD99_03625 [Candidatus Rokubacteria bacterium]